MEDGVGDVDACRARDTDGPVPGVAGCDEDAGSGELRPLVDRPPLELEEPEQEVSERVRVAEPFEAGLLFVVLRGGGGVLQDVPPRGSGERRGRG